MTTRHRLMKLRVALPALLALAGVSALFGGQLKEFLISHEVRVTVPSPDAQGSEMCRGLFDELPERTAGEERRETKPTSPFTAAWGDPAIVMRCGVPRPEEMSNPLALGGTVSGVDWMMERPGDGVYRCTTTYRKAYVEVTIPAGYGDVTALMDLAGAIKQTVPRVW